MSIKTFCSFLLLVSVALAFELGGGRPFKETPTRLFRCEMPTLLVHVTYSDAALFDTTERIQTFYENDLMTDIFYYRKTATIDTLSDWMHVTFNYEGDTIHSALLEVSSSGKMVSNTKEEFAFTDSFSSVITSVCLIPGYPLEKAFKDIYYPQDSTQHIRRSRMSYVDQGLGYSYWHEVYREIDFYNNSANRYDTTVKFFMTLIDTTWTTTHFSEDLDSSITTVINHNDSIAPAIFEKVYKTYDDSGRVTSILCSLTTTSLEPLAPYSREFYYYGANRYRYERQLFDTLRGNFFNSLSEEHLKDSKGRDTLIAYFDFDNGWQHRADDFLIYADYTIPIKNEHIKSSHRNIQVFESGRKAKYFIHGPSTFKVATLFTLSGRAVKSLQLYPKPNGVSIVLDKAEVSSGRYILKISGNHEHVTLPILIIQ